VTPTGLTQLLQSTQTLFSDPASLGAGLDWVDRILPRFTDACIHDVTHGTPEAFAAWRDWLTGDSVEGIRDAGEEEVFVWRRTWLQILVSASEELYNAGGNRPAEGKKLAESLYAQAPYVFSFFPKVFWFDLVDMLSSTRKAVSHTPASIRTSFPLVLAERMVIDGDNIDVLLADFELSPSGYSGGGLYLDPAQVATRCIDGAFAPIFAQAVTEVSRYVAPDTLPSVRVQLTPLKPEHEIFLQTLILRGPSGGGALAAGLYCLFKSYQPHRTLATSFALTAPGQTTPDGFCHAVGGAYEKVRGCAKAGMQNLLVAEEAAGQVRFYGHLQNVSIVGTSTLQDVFLYLDKSVETAPAEPINTDEDGGVLSLSSQLYIERRSDAAFHTALAQRPMIVLVKGARQIGKTSLLVRGVDQVRKSNVKLIYVDLQSIGRNNLKTQKDFFIAVARIFERELNLSVTMDELYDERDGPNKNFENFLFKYVLTSSVIWFMDEVDRLFDFDYYTDVFSLMRSWHNRRSVHRELGNLTLVLCYATETHLMIEDLYQSPFNVGTKIEWPHSIRKWAVLSKVRTSSKSSFVWRADNPIWSAAVSRGWQAKAKVWKNLLPWQAWTAVHSAPICAACCSSRGTRSSRKSSTMSCAGFQTTTTMPFFTFEAPECLSEMTSKPCAFDVESMRTTSAAICCPMRPNRRQHGPKSLFSRNSSGG